MTTKDLFQSNEIAVFCDFSGSYIGKVISQENLFLAFIFGQKSNPIPFFTLKKAVSFIESASIKKQETKIQEPVIKNQLKLF